ncbi:MAG: diguanylate cyclase, partial [Ruminococcus sp.]|nr:diguanylate cyclase [Ruminococcus sp.]
GQWWALQSKKIVDRWLEDGMVFDALVCANDNMAMAAADELYNHGLRVPEDVKVTGIDDLYASSCFIPRIATARFKHEEGICSAVDILRDIWAGKEVKKELVLGNDLMFAQSCGCGGNEDIKRVNGYAFDLSYNNEIIKVFDKHMIRFTNNVTTQQSFEESVDLIAHYCRRAWTREMWLCINDGFFDGQICQGEFAQIMQLLIKKDPYDSVRTDMRFMRSSTLPGIEEALENNKSILLMPLHIKENTIGYIAREFTSTQALDEWYIFSMNLCGMLDVIKNHQQLRNANARLERMYIHDSMTGLFNRRGFFKEIRQRYMSKAQPELIVVSADLDGLKEINDLYGHSEGDRAIETIAAALSYAGGDDFVCARFGGDEFISAGDYTEGAVMSFEDRFNDYLDRFNDTSGLPFKVNASIGIVSDRCTLDNIDSIISIADERMYLRKKERKQFTRQTPR